jgi:hypothetical protein
MVAEFIPTLKVALKTWLTGTLVAPVAGVVEMTVGGVGAATLVNIHT